jgi:hypothetical protein
MLLAEVALAAVPSNIRILPVAFTPFMAVRVEVYAPARADTNALKQACGAVSTLPAATNARKGPFVDYYFASLQRE